MPLGIAIVSDIHCHHPSAGYCDTLLLSDLPRRPEKQHPVSALDILIREKELSADVLLMPGDMANRADPQGINSAWDYVKSIARSLKTKVSASTLGNHDVIWKTAVDDSFKLARELLPQFPTDNDSQFHSFWSDGFYVEEQDDYRILVINSVQHQTNEEAAKRGLVSQHQLEAIERYLISASPKTYQLGLCHHHPIQHEEIELGPKDLMENGSLFVQLLSKYGFSLLVHGHKHHPRLKIDSSGGHPLPVFASGSFSAGMKLGLGTRARNVFHLINIDSISGTSAQARGTIRTWQFQHQLGWTEATQSAADFPHLAGFGAGVSASALAELVEEAFHAHEKPIVRWSSISRAVPDIDWVVPSVFARVGEILLTRGIELIPAAPDRPHHIGIPE